MERCCVVDDVVVGCCKDVSHLAQFSFTASTLECRSKASETRD
jgi:hypothetical protein